jgi:hypothetical protein
MSTQEAVAEVFIRAFRALTPAEQSAILAKMFRDQELREDLIDLTIAKKRSHEKARSFKAFLTKVKKERKSG